MVLETICLPLATALYKTSFVLHSPGMGTALFNPHVCEEKHSIAYLGAARRILNKIKVDRDGFEPPMDCSAESTARCLTARLTIQKYQK